MLSILVRAEARSDYGIRADAAGALGYLQAIKEPLNH